MILRKELLVRSSVAWLVVTPLLWLGPPINAQTQTSPAQDTAQTQDRDRDQDHFSVASRQELANFDRFLDDHQNIDRELRRDPSLVRNQDYLQNHPALQTYLQDHPMISQQLTDHPNAFMRAEDRYDRREDAQMGNRMDDRGRGDDRDRGRDQDHFPVASRQELSNFDRFLDDHQNIDRELRRDPSLVRSQNYLQNHPALQTYLQDHPMVSQQLTDHPNAFMRAEDRYDHYEDRTDNRMDDRDRDRRAQLANFDQFLDSHREIAEQVRRNPSLANNQQFVQNHPALQSYLNQNPQVRQDLRTDASGFMNQEARYDNREDAQNLNRDRDFDRNGQNNNQNNMNGDRDRDARNDNRRDNDNRTQARNDNDNRQGFDDRDRDNRQGVDNDRDRDFNRGQDVNRDRNINHGDVVAFDQFLDHHAEIAEQLRKNPTLATNQQWVQNHPALQSYLQAHQNVQSEIAANPTAFMGAENRYEAREDGMSQDQRGRAQDFGHFLGSHSQINSDLSKNPSLARSEEYKSSHPEFKTYLQSHPDVQNELSQQQSETFVKSALQFSTKTTTGTGTTGTSTSTTTGTTTGTQSGAKPPTSEPKPPKQQ